MKAEESTVTAYSEKFNVDLETARERLDKKYKAEVESVDAKEIALKCMKAIRTTLPKVQGLELREAELNRKFKVLEKAFWSLEKFVDKMDNEIDLLKKIAEQSVKTITELNKEIDLKLIQHNKVNIFRKTWLKILSILKK